MIFSPLDPSQWALSHKAGILVEGKGLSLGSERPPSFNSSSNT